MACCSVVVDVVAHSVVVDVVAFSFQRISFVRLSAFLPRGIFLLFYILCKHQKTLQRELDKRYIVLLKMPFQRVKQEANFIKCLQ